MWDTCPNSVYVGLLIVYMGLFLNPVIQARMNHTVTIVTCKVARHILTRIMPTLCVNRWLLKNPYFYDPKGAS